MSNDNYPPTPSPVPPPSQQPPTPPPYYPPYQYQPYSPYPPPRKSNAPLIIAVVIITAVVVVAVLAGIGYYEEQAQASNQQKSQAQSPIFIGAELDYAMTGDISGVSINGQMTMKIIDVTSGGYTMQYTNTGLPGGTQTSTQWYPLNDSSGVSSGAASSTSSGLGTLIDQEHMSTILGTKEVDHYQNKTSTETFDNYVTTDTGLLVKMTETKDNGNWITVTLSYTNIPYYGG